MGTQRLFAVDDVGSIELDNGLLFPTLSSKLSPTIGILVM
jgi:hypothetical protein